MGSQRKEDIDLTIMTLDELKALASKIEQILAIRQFEEDLSEAVREYQRRDPGVIRF